MSALTYVEGLGRAETCIGYGTGTHRPSPLRFIWHHVLPLTCGGTTIPANLVSLCDVCHYAVHRVMWLMATGAKVPRGATVEQRHIAATGYAQAVQLGTVTRIPDEGGAVIG